MENNTVSPQETVNQLYQHAADLLIHQKRASDDVVQSLRDRGLDEESANIVVNNLQSQISSAKKERANKDMLYGALWCVGGIAATAANIGFIFWGAIVFGAIQFFKGVVEA